MRKITILGIFISIFVLSSACVNSSVITNVKDESEKSLNLENNEKDRPLKFPALICGQVTIGLENGPLMPIPFHELFISPDDEYVAYPVSSGAFGFYFKFVSVELSGSTFSVFSDYELEFLGKSYYFDGAEVTLRPGQVKIIGVHYYRWWPAP